MEMHRVGRRESHRRVIPWRRVLDGPCSANRQLCASNPALGGALNSHTSILVSDIFVILISSRCPRLILLLLVTNGSYDLQLRSMMTTHSSTHSLLPSIIRHAQKKFLALNENALMSCIQDILFILKNFIFEIMIFIINYFYNIF